MGSPLLALRSMSYSVASPHVDAGSLPIIRDLSMTINAGDKCAIVGHNGAGKSTLLKLLHGLILPTQGTLSWHLAKATAHSQAMVFQKPVLLRASVQENIEFALRIRGAPAVVAAKAANTALREAGIDHLAKRSARLCSGGEQQRISLARALAMAPEILFLDEPTSNLDPQATQAIEAVISLMHLRGTTIVLSTHSMGQVKRIASRVLFMHEGRLLEDSAIENFFNRPQSTQAQLFLQGDFVC
jgi:tungstate transport system ATP-binding protein